MRGVDMLLQGVAPATRALLDADRRAERFEAGTDVLAWGHRPARLHQIVAGRAKAWRPGSDGQSVVLCFLHPGDCAGLIAACRGRNTVATITAVEALRTVSWPVALIRARLRADPRLAANALEIVARRAELLADRVQDLSSGRADQQLARALLRLAGEDGDWSDPDEATVPVTRQELADMTASTLHTASRTLSGWEARRLVHSTRGRVTITDPAALAAIAGLAA